MIREHIIERIRASKDGLQAMGVLHLALFGSRMRGDFTPDSDLDVLVDIDPSRPKFSLIDLAGICNAIEDLTGIETLAIERPMLDRHPDFQRRIQSDIVEVF